MNKNSKIYIAGHRGLVGSAILKVLGDQGYSNLVFKTHEELDLTNQAATAKFFEIEKPEYVFLAAAKVGGILANNSYPADFIYKNLAIQTNVIQSSYESKVKRLLFLGSSCIYPRECPQPMREEYLLTGPLESTNRPYAIAKIAGIEMCWSYNRQYGTKYLAAMPTNLFGPNDNYDLNASHVIPALLRKFHEAKQSNEKIVTVWGTGTPKREFLYSQDMAEACLFLMKLSDERFDLVTNPAVCPLVNIGTGHDLTIAALANAVKDVVGFKGEIVFDTSKPDGTPRKLMNVDRINQLGWHARTDFVKGLGFAYEAFLQISKK